MRRVCPGRAAGGDRFKAGLAVVEMVCGAHAVGGPLPRPRRRSVAAARRACQTLGEPPRRAPDGPAIQLLGGVSSALASRAVLAAKRRACRRPRRPRPFVVRPVRNGLAKSDSSSRRHRRSSPPARGRWPRRRAPGSRRPRGTGCTRLPEVFERLAGEGLEGRPALALLARAPRSPARPSRPG